MQKDIEAIFLDVGNTLRIVIKDPPFMADARQQLVELTGSKMSADAFVKLLEERYQVLRKRAKEKLIEASEKEMWTQWMLPDFPVEKIAPLSGKLTRLWRDCDGRRVPREDAKETILELHRRGYLLGIIANTITETEIPDYLDHRQPDRDLQDGCAFLQGGDQEAEPGDLLGSRPPHRCGTGEMRLRG